MGKLTNMCSDKHVFGQTFYTCYNRSFDLKLFFVFKLTLNGSYYLRHVIRIPYVYLNLKSEHGKGVKELDRQTNRQTDKPNYNIDWLEIELSCKNNFFGKSPKLFADKRRRL